MPIFATLLRGLFGSFAGMFAAWASAKVATGAAAIAAFAVLVGASTAAIAALMSGVLALLPTGGVLSSVMMFQPPSTPFICASCLSVDGAIFLYKWNRENIRIASYVT